MSMEIFSTIEFQMSLLLFVALAGYMIASRINQSAVVGIILAGILVGPGVLGVITYTDFVSNLAHFGAIVLLFTIGLHFKLKDIMKMKYFWIALAGIILPWIAGYFIGKLFGFTFGSSIFIGTALTATSIAITANVLKEMNKLDSEVAKAIIGAAVIDDVLSLLALSVSEQIVSGTLSSILIWTTLLKAGLFIFIFVILGNIFTNKIIAKLDNSLIAKKYPEFVFIFAMMLAFIYAMTAQIIGLSAIVGAFLAGVAMEGVGLTHSKSFREGSEYLHIIFASIFFISLGILVDIKTLDLNLAWFILVLTLIAVITKVIACGIPALLQGSSLNDSLVIGFGMVPRGEVAMIIALIGLNQGLITSSVYTAIVLMSVLTTIITPIVLRNWLLKASS